MEKEKHSKKKFKILIIAAALIVLVSLGFHLYKVLDPAYRLFRPVINATNSNVLRYDGCYIEYNGVYKCNFMVVSENAEGVGDELKIIYDEVNQLLKSEEICIEILVHAPRDEYGVFQVISAFINYEGLPPENADIYNHICYVCGNGINSDVEFYDSNYDYEINHKEYWEYFSDAEELIYPQE